MVELSFKKYDLAIKRADAEGRAIVLFVGQRDDEGKIRGERYVRRLVLDTEGKKIKDHWDHKGKAT